MELDLRDTDTDTTYVTICRVTTTLAHGSTSLTIKLICTVVRGRVLAPMRQSSPTLLQVQLPARSSWGCHSMDMPLKIQLGLARRTTGYV